MEALILTILPVAVVIAIGYLTVRFNYISSSAVDGISRYVFAIALPALIFRNMANGGLPGDLGPVWQILLSYYLGALAVLILGLLVGQYLFRAGMAEQNLLAVGASHSNLVLLGVPAVLMILGTRYIVPLALVVGLHGLIMALLVTAVGRVRAGKTAELPAALGQAALNQVKNPVFISLALGVAYSFVASENLPDMVNSILRLLSSALYPCALFALGGTLVRYGFGGQMKEAAAITALKLAAHPAIVWVLAKPVLGLSTSWTWVAVMLALMPAGFNIHNMANRSEKGIALAGTAIVLSTVLSAVAVIAMLAIRQG